MATGFELLKDAGSYAARRPIATLAGMTVASAGLGMGINALANPIDTAANVYTGAKVASEALNPGTVGAGLGVAAGAAGLAAGAYGLAATKTGRNITKKVAKGFAGVNFNAEPNTAPRISRYLNPTRLIPRAWDGGMPLINGPKRTFAAVTGLGALYGGAKAAVSIASTAPTYSESMANSVEGSAYEQGPQSFGQRNSRARTLGESAMGLVNGLHNRR